ncbi:hypothetical protein BGM19_38495 [Streptomyces agglomeratus]|uniref:Lipoprotein n=1 Tax=Streptomyces agglomeratus TaxID=285458 RepID=A0A1E5NZN1_9ACTN|nr:hypothetical protein AS594_38345 [Streptomyces agglomeratus]OEJ36554.1 hypothetical protein BGK72_37575 [Streptomyces agglomeratus]OEJ56670.1 hypothetical protein BGM19_38495 [Streptomyces agglomeratus]
MRTRTIASVAISACVALVACACSPETSKEDGAAKPSRPSSPMLATEPSVTPPASTGTEKPSTTPTGDQPAPRTKARAIQRYEHYLHALGREDIDTVCEVAGPGAKKAQEEGFGPCTSTYVVVFQMISPAQKKALQTATVDPEGIAVRTLDKIEMPLEAVRASATFSESDLGSYTLEYIKNDYYIVDGK